MMWRNNNLTEADGKARHDNAAFSGTVSPSTGKRQRRPSVRLEEIGDQHADRTRVCSALTNVYSPAHSNENLCPSNVAPDNFKLAKLSYSRVGALAKNCGRLKDSTPVEERGSCYINRLPEPNPDCKEVMNENQMMQRQKSTSNKGRGGKKPGVPKVATSRPQSGTSIRGCGKVKVLCMQAAKGVHSDKENNAHTSEVFIASASDNSFFGSGQVGEMLLNVQHNCKEERQYLAAHTQVRGGSTGQWPQASSRRRAFEVMDDADGGLLAQPNARGPRGKLVITKKGLSQDMQDRFVVEVNGAGNSMEPTYGRHLGQAKRSAHGSKGKLVITGNRRLDHMQNRLVLEKNGSGNSTEATKDDIDYIASDHSLPLVGVREWLHNLGLGKYARLFEAHEVEPEVLPLLTFDDLREIGVFAVGPRRKMFCAIQQFRKVPQSVAY